MARRSRIRSASAQVVGSALHGPEAISAGSSPGTSETRSDTTRAGAQRAPSRPPCSCDRCLRTQLISWMAAPLASRARLTSLRSPRVSPGNGNGDAVPIRRRTRARARDRPSPIPWSARQCRGPRRLPPYPGPGARPRARQCGGWAPVPVARDDDTFNGLFPGRLHRRRHDGSRFTGADDERASARRERQRRCDGARRVRRGDGGVEKRPQQLRSDGHVPNAHRL